jgi:5,10-methylenetetrahydromethanopterin reductase
MGLDPERPLAAVRDAISIVRTMLAGEEIDYTGQLFSARKVKLEYEALRPDMPLLMAARGDKALALCGELADGLMISNMCPPQFTRHAVEVMRRSAGAVGRGVPAEVVQYIPCVTRPDRGEALRIAKEAVARLLPDYWSLGQRVPSAKSALLRGRDLSEADIVAAVEGLRAGRSAAEMLDDRFLAAFALAGTAQDCLDQAQSYTEAGATELVLTFAGPQPEADMRYLGSAVSALS